MSTITGRNATRYPWAASASSNPGEAHSSWDPYDRETPAAYRLLYAGPSVLREAASGISGRDRGLPTFPDPVFVDEDLARDFLCLHLASEGAASRLEQDSRLLGVSAGSWCAAQASASCRILRSENAGP